MTHNSDFIPTTLQTFRISGMDCAGCAQSLEKAVAGLDQVDSCDVNFTTEILRMQGGATPEEIVACVRSMGFDVVEPSDEEASTESVPQNFWHYLWARFETRCALFAAFLMVPGLVLHELLGREAAWMNVTSLAAMGLAGWPIAISAWRALRNRQITINVLMTVAALGAAIIGAFAEAGMVLVLFALGEALEGYTGSRSRHAIRSLMEVAPQTALRIATASGDQAVGEDVVGEEVVVHIRELAIGDTILVKPGERIPMDGRVLAGESAVNQAAITGESRPIDKAPGVDVFAGSINGEGTLTLRVTTLAEDNTISRVIAMVEEAQERKAPAQRFVDRFAQIYTPAVMALALAVATLPPLLLGQPFLNPDPSTFGWLYRGLALLVVACPCALVISTPVSIISAITNGARHGVLFKGGAHVEALSRVQCVALDKTGTLTLGTPTVLTVYASGCRDKMRLHGPEDESDKSCADCAEVLALASAVERYSEHPLARAIVAASEQQGLQGTYPPAQSVRALPGRGVTGTVEGQELLVGSHAYFDQHIGHAAERCRDATADAARGHTPMLVSVDGTYRGTITVSDALRPSSAAAVSGLRQLGLEQIVMLTGDHASTAAALAESVDIHDVRAELLPGDKLDAVRSLEQECGSTAMVGDGINDAPALAAATVGIAMGGATSSAQAMETADITLMSDDLRQLPFAIRLSRAAMRTIRANVVLSIGIKLIFLVLVLLGWGTLWMAVLADVGTSLLVTLNGMRLLRRPVLAL